MVYGDTPQDVIKELIKDRNRLPVEGQHREAHALANGHFGSEWGHDRIDKWYYRPQYGISYKPPYSHSFKFKPFYNTDDRVSNKRDREPHGNSSYRKSERGDDDVSIKKR